MFKSLANLDPKRQKLIVLTLPTVTLILSLTAILPAAQQYGKSKRDLEKMRGEMSELIRNLPKPDNTRIYFVRNEARESTMFVREIAAIAKGSACDLSALSSPATQEASGGSGGKGGGDAPWYVTPVTVQVSLVGSYPDIRRFLAGVVNSRRVYSITGLDLRARWSAEDGTPDTRVSAVVRVERYIALRARPTGKTPPVATDQSIPGLK